jgi:hypothetical protein
VFARRRGDDGYTWPDGTGAASYAGRLDLLALSFLLDRGGVVNVALELAILDATASSSSVSELSSFGCEKMLAGGTMTDDSPVVVDVTGTRTELRESRPEDELASGKGTPYGARGSVCANILGLMTAPLVGADCVV